MKKIVLASRILLGLVFLVFGANGLMMTMTGNGFIPMPPPPESMQTIMAGFAATHYLMALVKVLEVIAGILLLIGCYRNLAITLLGPIVVNILCLHIFAEPSGAPMAIVITFLYAVLVKDRWDDFKVVLKK